MEKSVIKNKLYEVIELINLFSPQGQTCVEESIPCFGALCASSVQQRVFWFPWVRRTVYIGHGFPCRPGMEQQKGEFHFKFFS